MGNQTVDEKIQTDYFKKEGRNVLSYEIAQIEGSSARVYFVTNHLLKRPERPEIQATFLSVLIEDVPILDITENKVCKPDGVISLVAESKIKDRLETNDYKMVKDIVSTFKFTPCPIN